MRILGVLLLSIIVQKFSFAQKDIRQLRDGNKLYNNSKYNESELAYRRALDADPSSVRARFNLGDALYKQGKFQESADLFADLAASENSPAMLSKVYHNLGNSLLKANKLQESIDAYKNSLRINPADQETRYNLAYAQNMLKQQQQNQNNQNNTENKDQQAKDQQNNKDEKQQQNKEQNKQNQNSSNQQNQQKNNPDQQDKKAGMTKEEANRILQALQNNEKQTREKINKQQFKAKRIKTEKDW